MMVTNHFEINIAKDMGRKNYEGNVLYEHWCRIELPDPFEEKAIEKLRTIREKFAAPEYKCTLEYIQCGARIIKDKED